MLDELCPVQFIEGINECAEYKIDDDFILPMRDFARVAIEYKPNISVTESNICVTTFLDLCIRII